MAVHSQRRTKSRLPASDADDALWRLFLAVPLSADVQSLLAEQIAAFDAQGWPVRWIDPRSAHLTLQFLGDTEPERAELVRLALPDIVASHSPISLRTAAFGVFPNFRRPRVLWLGLHGPVHRLASLQQDVGQTLADLGFTGNDEPYHPHITLGRVRNHDGEGVRLRDLPRAVKRRFVDAQSGAAIAPPAQPVPVDEVHLMRSHLGREGARYEVIASFPLGRL